MVWTVRKAGGRHPRELSLHREDGCSVLGQQGQLESAGCTVLWGLEMKGSSQMIFQGTRACPPPAALWARSPGLALSVSSSPCLTGV